MSINGTNNNIINALVSMINFFKSYTQDLRNLNILYYLDDKFYNKIRMIHDPSLFVRMYPEIKALKYNDTLNIFTGFDKHDRLVIFSREEIDNVLLSDDRDRFLFIMTRDSFIKTMKFTI